MCRWAVHGSLADDGNQNYHNNYDDDDDDCFGDDDGDDNVMAITMMVNMMVILMVIHRSRLSIIIHVNGTLDDDYMDSTWQEHLSMNEFVSWH